MSEHLAFAESLADQAGMIMVDKRNSALSISIKPNRTLVTDVDYKINRLVINEVRAAYPHHGVIGEELSYNIDADEVWIVDPLDGTSNYIEGGDYSTFGIAKRTLTELELGVIHNPFRDEKYIALRGLGAFLNSHPIKVNQEDLNPDTRYDYCHWEGALVDVRKLELEFGQRMGYTSALYQACMVASGTSTFSVFPGDTLHDVAAGAILVEEAGGMVTGLDGEPLRYNANIRGAVLSNKITHREVVRRIGAIARAA